MVAHISKDDLGQDWETTEIPADYKDKAVFCPRSFCNYLLALLLTVGVGNGRWF